MHAAEGVRLPGGRMTSGLVRHGDRVRRPAGPWSPAGHEDLRPPASAGFEGSPRVAAAGGGGGELAYIEGGVGVEPDWPPGRGDRRGPGAGGGGGGGGGRRGGRRGAAAGSGRAGTPSGSPPPPPLPGEVVSHGDLGPWNTVYRDGAPVAFIDWDGAGPVEPVA